MNDTVRAYDLDAWRADALRDAALAGGWTDVDVRSGIDGKRSEHWLELAAVRA